MNDEKEIWIAFDKHGNKLGRVTATDEKTAINAASKAWFGKFSHLESNETYGVE